MKTTKITLGFTQYEILQDDKGNCYVYLQDRHILDCYIDDLEDRMGRIYLKDCGLEGLHV